MSFCGKCSSETLLWPKKSPEAYSATESKINLGPLTNRQSWTNWTLPHSTVKWLAEVFIPLTVPTCVWSGKGHFRQKERNWSCFPRQTNYLPLTTESGTRNTVSKWISLRTSSSQTCYCSEINQREYSAIMLPLNGWIVSTRNVNSILINGSIRFTEESCWCLTSRFLTDPNYSH